MYFSFLLLILNKLWEIEVSNSFCAGGDFMYGCQLESYQFRCNL